MLPVPAVALTPKQEAFAQMVAGGASATAAYRAAFDVRPATSTRTVQQSAYELTHTPRVASRIADLRTAVAERFVDNLANLRARQFDIATAGPLTHVRVFNCRCCHGANHKHQWRDADEFTDAVELWQATLATKPSPQPNAAGGMGFDPFAPPNAQCPVCLGAGVPVVYVADTTQLTAAQRAAFKGASVDRWGQIHVEQHDAQEAARELHRMVPGAIAPARSEAKSLNVSMTAEQAMEIAERPVDEIVKLLFKRRDTP